jgi:hypothetical protein
MSDYNCKSMSAATADWNPALISQATMFWAPRWRESTKLSLLSGPQTKAPVSVWKFGSVDLYVPQLHIAGASGHELQGSHVLDE